MPQQVVSGASAMCSFGMAPSSVMAMPRNVLVEGRPAATIDDVAPLANVAPFGMCRSLANPTVAAATAAALGTLTPMPCVPVPVGTWTPTAPRTTVGGSPALASGATLRCAYGGVINITMAGSATTQVS